MTLAHRLPTNGPVRISFENVAAGMWSTDDVAEFLGTSRSALYAAVRRGDFDDVVIRVGNRVLWPGPALAKKVGL